MSLYAPSPLIAQSGAAAGYVLSKPKVATATGAVSRTDFWNHVDGVFDGPYDKAKHLSPFARVGVDANDPDFTLQFASVPVDALADHKTIAVVYTIGANGDRADLLKAYEPAGLRRAVGLDD